MLQQRFIHYRRTKKNRETKVTIKRQLEQWGGERNKKARLEEIEVLNLQYGMSEKLSLLQQLKVQDHMNFIFQVPRGEDEASFRRHRLTLINEYKKKKRNMALVDQLMNVTFAQRRNHIVNSGPSVCDIASRYSFLQMPQEVSCCCVLTVRK